MGSSYSPTYDIFHLYSQRRNNTSSKLLGWARFFFRHRTLASLKQVYESSYTFVLFSLIHPQEIIASWDLSLGHIEVMVNQDRHHLGYGSQIDAHVSLTTQLKGIQQSLKLNNKRTKSLSTSSSSTNNSWRKKNN